MATTEAVAVALASRDAARSGAVLVVDLGAVVANWRQVAAIAAPAECAAVVKADAYGLGAVPIATALFAAGCRTFFTVDIASGLRLKAAVPGARIVLLHGVPAGTESDFVAGDLIPALNSPGDIERWTEAGARAGRRLPCFVHIDTGMNRLGLSPAEVAGLAQDPSRLTGIDVRVWMSHLACADLPDHPLNRDQPARFADALHRLPKARASLANSAGIFHGAHLHHDLVRPGIALHGANPTPWRANPMRPVVRLLARVHQVRRVEAGATVGYDATHPVRSPTRVAALGLGYADGYPWSLAGTGSVRFGDHEAPVIGRVSMDLLTVDVTGVPEPLVHEGAWAEVIGPDRPVDAIAKAAGTIPYEVLTRLGDRFHRVHLP